MKKVQSESTYTVTMKGGSTFLAPRSWKNEARGNYIQMTSPEKDLSAYFFEFQTFPKTLQAKIQNFVELATKAWKEINPHFNLKPLPGTSHSATNPWEKMVQIVFDVPTSESRIVMAVVRIFKEQAYLSLIEGTIAGFSRRAAELNIQFETWKPVGHQESLLSNNETKIWTAADIQEFEKFMLDSMQKLKIPGVSVAIVCRDGKTLYSKGLGVKRIGTNDAVTIDTCFMIGSITKPLTTLLMAMLVDQKKLSWQTPMTNILKDFALGDLDLTRKLQIRHTVSASTGMPSGGFESLFKYNGIKPEDRLLEMRSMKPTTKIGETFQYSNYLVMAGGYAAARASTPEGSLENAYAVAMQKYVFNPLQMKNSVLKPEDARKRGAAMPHATDFNGQLGEIPLGIEHFAYGLAPAGAVWSTVEDLSKYLLLEMNNGLLGGKRVISEESILERRKPGVRIGEKSFYGLCLLSTIEQGLNLVGHGGNTMGFSSDLFFLPEKGLGMVILTNAYHANPFLALVKQKFLELTFSAKPRSEEMLKAALLEKEHAIKMKHRSISFDPKQTSWMEDLLGEYTSKTLGEARLAKMADGVHYEMEFTEWKAKVGCELEKGGKKILVLIDAPSHGGIKLMVEDNGTKLVLDWGQEKHDFTRKACKARLIRSSL